MEKAVLRMAAAGDAAAMLAVYAPYVTQSTASWEYEAPCLSEFTRRVEEHLAAGFPWLVAQEGDDVLGYAYAGRFAQRRGYDWDAETTVYLAPPARGRHVGTALYTALLELLRRQGYVNCYALVTHPNEPSEAFHAAMGFREAARLPAAGYKAGEWLGLCYFHRALCPPPAAPQAPVPVRTLAARERDAILRQAAALVRPAKGKSV